MDGYPSFNFVCGWIAKNYNTFFYINMNIFHWDKNMINTTIVLYLLVKKEEYGLNEN